LLVQLGRLPHIRRILLLLDTQQLSRNGRINFRELRIHFLLVLQQLPSDATCNFGMQDANVPYVATDAPDSYALILVIELFAVLSERPASVIELRLEWIS
jgi:hypothetical protein